MRIILFPLLLLLFSCEGETRKSPFETGPRNVDWQKEWKQSSTKLKELTADVKEHPAKYVGGNNDFPSGFKYPFDDGFHLRRSDSIHEKFTTIVYYLDRGILDHYSAFIYTDSGEDTAYFNAQVARGGNDFRIEPNWYIIND